MLLTRTWINWFIAIFLKCLKINKQFEYLNPDNDDRYTNNEKSLVLAITDKWFLIGSTIIVACFVLLYDCPVVISVNKTLFVILKNLRIVVIYYVNYIDNVEKITYILLVKISVWFKYLYKLHIKMGAAYSPDRVSDTFSQNV